MENERYFNLDDFELPHIRLYEDGKIYNENVNMWWPLQKNGHLEFVSPISKIRIRLSHAKLMGYYFRAPWRQRVQPMCRSLEFFGFSRYTVDSFGRVFSTFTWDYLIGNLSFDGYQRVLMSSDKGTNETHIVHRLVAMAFIPNPCNKPEVNHINGNKLDNSVGNLEWVYPFENVEHALKTGLRKFALNDDLIHKICQRLECGDRVLDICNDFNIKKHTVLGIKSGCHNRISQHYNIPRNKHF